jgi:uncharacterized protein involved in exopolysaccharide biosynthesis
MSNEIDLPSIIAALRRRWWVVLIFVLLALAIALGFSLVQPRSYQATSMLLVQSPRYQWRFDASFIPLVDSRRDYQRETLAISRSNEIAQQAAQALQAAGIKISAEELASAVSVRAGDSTTIMVTATAGDAAVAAAMANAWTDGLLQFSRQLYGVSQDLANFENELQTARERLREIEGRLEQVRVQTGIYDVATTPEETMKFSPNQELLTMTSKRLAEYESDLAGLRYLQSQLAQPGADLESLPWERLAGPVISARSMVTPQMARDSLDDPARLQALLQQEEVSLAAAAQELTAELEQIQASVAGDWRTYDELMRDRNLLRETYQILVRKVAELSLQRRVDPGLVTLVSQAEPPSKPLRTRQLAQVVTAGAIGLILGVLAALWLDIWLRRKTRRGDGADAPSGQSGE